ncbi:MAG: hypothetical protein K0R73_588 [Candidatus Midichloriaceae bacterium]|jgi:hypothetical protein|nr:hypothetical protein [Candidatus Midichloriaceae bacterium]
MLGNFSIPELISSDCESILRKIHDLITEYYDGARGKYIRQYDNIKAAKLQEEKGFGGDIKKVEYDFKFKIRSELYEMLRSSGFGQIDMYIQERNEGKDFGNEKACQKVDKLIGKLDAEIDKIFQGFITMYERVKEEGELREVNTIEKIELSNRQMMAFISGVGLAAAALAAGLIPIIAAGITAQTVGGAALGFLGSVATYYAANELSSRADYHRNGGERVTKTEFIGVDVQKESEKLYDAFEDVLKVNVLTIRSSVNSFVKEELQSPSKEDKEPTKGNFISYLNKLGEKIDGKDKGEGQER